MSFLTEFRKFAATKSGPYIPSQIHICALTQFVKHKHGKRLIGANAMSYEIIAGHWWWKRLEVRYYNPMVYDLTVRDGPFTWEATPPHGADHQEVFLN